MTTKGNTVYAKPRVATTNKTQRRPASAGNVQVKPSVPASPAPVRHRGINSDRGKNQPSNDPQHIGVVRRRTFEEAAQASSIANDAWLVEDKLMAALAALFFLLLGMVIGRL